jgi:hypothetical protein
MSNEPRRVVRAVLRSEDGNEQDVGDQVVGAAAFVDSWQRSKETPDEFSATGWQRTDDVHPPGAGRRAYRVVYKTLRLVPFPSLVMSWPNLRISICNGDVERGGLRVPTGIAGRTARHLIIPEYGRVRQQNGAVTYLSCPDLNYAVAGWEETLSACSYVELLYLIDDPTVWDLVPKNAAKPDTDRTSGAFERALTQGRAGVASLKTLLDLHVGPRLLAMPLTEEVGEVFDDWHWTRRLDAGLFSAETQASRRQLDTKDLVAQLQPLIDRHQALSADERRRLTLASQWYWRADADTDASTRFISWWLSVESLEMPSTNIKPVRKRIAYLTSTTSERWAEPIGRLFRLRGELVHGNVDEVPADAGARVEALARALLASRLLGAPPKPFLDELSTAFGVSVTP